MTVTFLSLSYASSSQRFPQAEPTAVTVTAVLGGCAEHLPGTLILKYFDDEKTQYCNSYRSLWSNAPKKLYPISFFFSSRTTKKMF